MSVIFKILGIKLRERAYRPTSAVVMSQSSVIRGTKLLKFELFRRTNFGELLDMSSGDVQPTREQKNIISNMNCEFGT